MKNVTLHVLRYREAARHLWNVYLREDGAFGGDALPDGAVLDDWESLRNNLFFALVLRRTDAQSRPVNLSERRPISFLRVVPTSPEVPAMVSRTKPAKTYWDNPIQRLGPTDDLRFIDFFDFDQSGFLDFTYCHVAISSSEHHPDLKGHEALIEVQYVNVFGDDA
jgi:hypothetical protein